MARKKVDLADVQRELNEHYLLKAIQTNDRKLMAESLRKVTGGMSEECFLKLADFLDPDIENPLYKAGPKKKKKKQDSFLTCSQVAGFYHYLCQNKEAAQSIIYAEKDGAGNPMPKATQIKDWICKAHGINERTFDDMLSYYNTGKKPK